MVQIRNIRCARLRPVSQAASVLPNLAENRMSGMCSLEEASSNSAVYPTLLEIAQGSLFQQDF